MKPKAITLQQKFGFNDTELTTPQHDAMILWLIKHKVQVAHYLMPKAKHNCGWRLKKSDLDSALPAQWEDARDQSPRAKTEVAIQSGTFVVGFIDLVIYRSNWVVESEWVAGSKCSRVTVEFSEDFSTSYGIEVKPSIRSFGETMRQIRHYQVYTNMPFAIFTPDETFKDAFNEQGVKCFGPKDVAEFVLSDIASLEAGA